MQGFDVLKVYDLAAAPINIGDCFDLGSAAKNAVTFTSAVRVGFRSHVSSGQPDQWWSRELTFSEYQLYQWLLEHGAYDGETVLVCWTGGG